MFSPKSLILVIFCGIQLIEAMQITMGSCPKNLTVVGDFDANRFKGRWFVDSRTQFLNLKLAECTLIDYDRTNEGFAITIKEVHPKKKVLVVKTINAAIQGTEGRMHFKVNDKTLPNGIDIHILETDYTNYAIRFLCANVDTAVSFQWLSIITRKRNANSKVTALARHIIEKHGLKLSELKQVTQTTCPSMD